MRIVIYVTLAALCVGSMLLAFPAADKNAGDPDLVVYFNHDEGYLMDLAWQYYSGEKRPSYQYEGDYGLELVYIAAFARAVLRKFMDVTPGTFVLIVRWLHLAAWAASLIALWRLMMRHFGKVWQAFIVVLLLNIKLATIYFVNAMKPDPLVIFFMIIGIDYALRIMNGRPWTALAAATAAGACAFIVKFSGIFLLPMIVAAMYLRQSHDRATAPKAVFPRLKAAWTVPAIAGSVLVALPLAIVFLYHRRVIGLTWYEQYGFLGTLERNAMVTDIIAAGAVLIALSFVYRIVRAAKIGWLRDLCGAIDDIGSCAMIALGFFALFFLVFGFGWVLNPRHLLELYAITGREAFGYPQNAQAVSSGIAALIGNFASNVRIFDPGIFALFAVYLAAEFGPARRKAPGAERKLFHKRMALLVFLLPYSMYMCSGGRVALQHTLPFFTVMAVLGLEGARMLFRWLEPRRALALAASAAMALAVAVTVVQDTKAMASEIVYIYRQKEDVVFDIAEWWRDNYPPDTKILAAHPTRVYLPPEYANVKFLRFQLDEAQQLRNLLVNFKPELVYYNARPGYGADIPGPEELVPGIRAELVASFDNEARPYARFPKAKFVIYRIRYR